MTRRLLLIAATVVAAVGSAVVLIAQPTRAAGPRPNVVLIMMDDMGYSDIGSYGGRDAKTPNLDRLAREGVRLTDAYSNGANCTPTRAALITGRYQQRVGLEWALNSVPDADRGLVPSSPWLKPLLAHGCLRCHVARWRHGRALNGIAVAARDVSLAAKGHESA